jgi:hypothetical protein
MQVIPAVTSFCRGIFDHLSDRARNSYNFLSDFLR